MRLWSKGASRSVRSEGVEIATKADRGNATATRVTEAEWSAHVEATPPNRHRRATVVRRALAISDLTALTIAFFASVLIFSHGTKVDSPRLGLWALIFLLSLPLWLVFAKTLDLYARDDSRADHSTADETLGVVNLVTLGTWVIFVTGWATDLSHPQLNRMVAFWAFALTLVLSGRVVARTLVRRMPAYIQRSVVLGAGHVGQLLARKIQQHPEYGIRLLGFVDENPRARRAEVASLPMLGGLQDLPEVVSRLGIDRVIVAFSGEEDERTMAMVRSLRDEEVIVDFVPRLYELVGPRADIHLIEGLPLVTVPPARLPRSSQLAKRLVDIDLRVRDPDRHRPGLRGRGLQDPPAVTRARLLPPDAARHEHAPVHGAQVPDDACRHRRCRAPRVHQEHR